MMEKKILSKSFLVAIVFVGVVGSLGFAMAQFYKQECQKSLHNYQLQEQKRVAAKKIQTAKLQLQKQKQKAQKIVSQLDRLLQKKNKEIQENIRLKLKQKVLTASKRAQFIYDRYQNKQSNKERIISIVKNIVVDSQNSLFITNFAGDSILLGPQGVDKTKLNFYMDADARSIILEELQKVRKHTSGFLESDFYTKGSKYIIYVQDLKMFDMFIGSMASVSSAQKSFEKELFSVLSSVLVDTNEFLLLYKDKKIFYKSQDITIPKLEQKNTWHTSQNLQYYSQHNQAMGYTLVYGFIPPSKQELSSN